MSLFDCIRNGLAAGEIDPKWGKAAQKLYRELYDEAARVLGPAAAAQHAGDETRRIVGDFVARRRRRLLLQADAWERVRGRLENFRTLRDKPDMGEALLSLFDKTVHSGETNIEMRYRTLRGELFSTMAEAAAAFHPDVLGRERNAALMRNVEDEAFGKATGDAAAAEIAAGWKVANELAWRNHNAAGGELGKLDNFALPMRHDPAALRRLSLEMGHDLAARAWADFVKGLVDLDAMKARSREGVFERRPQSQAEAANQARRAMERGRAPSLLEDVDLDRAILEAFDTIATEGASKTDAETGARGAGRRMEAHRFLIFKDAESWRTYRDRFGRGDAYSIMANYLDRMARETARMQVLGPNPEVTFKAAADLVRKAAAERDLRETRGGVMGAIGRTYQNQAQFQIRVARDLFDGQARAEMSTTDSHIAGITAGVRNVETAAKLGSAVVPAVPGDLSTQLLTRWINGMPVRGMLKGIARQLNPRDPADRMTALRAWLITEDYIRTAAAQARFLGDSMGPAITARLSDTVLRVTGLSPWTSGGERAFGMDFYGALADTRHLPFEKLNKQWRRTLAHYGFSGDRWDQLRATEPTEHRGATFLMPNDILRRTDLPEAEARDLAYRYMDMIHDQQGYAVPSTTARGRATMIGHPAPGSPAHFILSSTLMFKSFSMTILHTWLKRVWNQPTWGERLKWSAAFFGATTIAGALGVQMREILSGRDPLDMTDPRFIGQAVAAGGGAAIFGDFLYAPLARGNTGLPEALSGPGVGLAADILNLASAGGMSRGLGGQDKNFGRALVGMLRRHMPGSNAWYLRLALSRYVFDRMQEWLDPRAAQAFRQDIGRRRREQGQKYWFRPGQTAPDRPPDFSAAVGATP